jgi:hypothetical protein
MRNVVERIENTQTVRSETRAAATETASATATATPDAIDLELDLESDANPASATRKKRVFPDAAATDATAETTESGSEPEASADSARRRDRRVFFAEPAFSPRTAFRLKRRAGARPPSPVSPLTPSGVVISPLMESLRGVRKSLA